MLQQSAKRVTSILLLEEEPFRATAEEANPFLTGLIFLLILGLILGIAQMVGTLLAWGTMPSLDSIKGIVLQGLTEMPWFKEMARNPRALQTFRQQYDLGWQFFPTLFGAPSPVSAFSSIVTTPLWMIASWLVFGILVHIAARLLGGTAPISQTFGVTALANAPMIFNVITIFPGAQAAGLGLWSLLCAYIGVKSVHRLSTGRAIGAILLPYVFLFVSGLLLVCTLVILTLTFFTSVGGFVPGGVR